MILLFDIGNTHSHLGLAEHGKIRKRTDVPTAGWFDGRAPGWINRFMGRVSIEGVALCSVVPRATKRAKEFARQRRFTCLELKPQTIYGLGIDYPKPNTIGPDRLANAMAVKHLYGAPAVVVDFGTAVTFDVVDARGNYSGGIIAPGLAAMTEYLHEKTALLPRIQIREVKVVVGKNTAQAMLVGAVRGYRGLVRQLIHELREELHAPSLPVVATGGYAGLIARKVSEITAVEPLLTLHGLRLAWEHRKRGSGDN